MTEDLTPKTETPVCYRHPGRETAISCVRCERPICPDCMRPASVGFQCPECVQGGGRAVRTARTIFGGDLRGERGTVTRVLVGLNVGIFLLTVVAALVNHDVTASQLGQVLVTGRVTGLTEAGAAVPLYHCADGVGYCGGIATGQFYRLITADFLHYGLIHLGFNMYALWIVGRECERLLGRWRYTALYLLTGIGGSVSVYLFGSPTEFSAGASASIFGLFAALFFLFRRAKADPRGLVFLIVLNFGLGFFVSNISVLGHLGGLVTGAIVGAVMAYLPPGRVRLQAAALGGVAVLLAIAVVIRTIQYAVL